MSDADRLQLAKDLIRGLRGTHILVEGSEITSRTEQLLAAMEYSQIATWEWNALTGETSFNDMWYRLVGLEPGALPERLSSWSELVHPDDQERVVKDMDDYLKGRTSRYLSVHRRRHGDGRWIWIRDCGIATRRTSDGRPWVLIGTLVDVTTLKELEAEIARQGELLSSITAIQNEFIEEAATDRVFQSLLDELLEVTRSEYGFVGEVHYDDDSPYLRTHAISDIAWNEETRLLYERDSPTLEFRNLDTLFGYAIKNRTIVISNDCARDPRRGGLPEGHPRLESFLGVPLVRGDRMLGLVGLANRPGGYSRDFGEQLGPLLATTANLLQAHRTAVERKDFELQAQQAQKWESIGLLAGGIAHDFNNMLAVIMANAEIMASRISEAERVHLDGIVSTAESAAGLCTELLAYAGRGRLEKKSVDLDALMRETSGLVRAALPKKVRLELKPGSTNRFCTADPTQIQQVVMNLVSNAAEAIGDRIGNIVLETGAVSRREAWTCRLTAETLEPGDYLLLQVLDDGPGLSEEAERRLFEPFFSTKGMGRGLGLSSVLGIVRGHRGDLDYGRTPEGRTYFRILLPGASGPDAETGDTELKGELGTERRPTVLVVDDEAPLRELMGLMIRGFSYEVVAASDGEEGLSVFQERRDEIDLVLLDLSMPRMGGLEAAARMEEIDASIPVILMSGYDDARFEEGLALENVVTHLQKPFRKAVLKGALGEVLG